ncbi:hypothetical protein AST06_00085 [Staphylococcus saprophyticus]|uniref:helix-turn-helix domain-containing protein n=1 Tax=Staphylococcus saprophyticus TaxID=29385 RepID=UPI0008530C92|nr:helix-turn-helix domain-containing protein [Staphylococcus saprophyticus]OEK76432.1 hypothetical protein AST06_00085 [Staphylococcus saprophyticus]
MGKHYKYEFKLKVVQEYLNSSLGYRALAKKYEISTKSLIERWIAQYKEFGPEGLSKRSFFIITNTTNKLPIKNDLLH